MAAWDGQTLESQGPDVVAMFGGDAGKWEAEHNAALRAQGWSGPGQPPGSQQPGGKPPSPPSGSPPSGPSGGQPQGEVSMTLEQLKLQYAQQAAYQAYLNAKQQGDNEQIAISRATQEANVAYQRAQIEQQEKSRLSSGMQGAMGLVTERNRAYNQAQSDFERSGVASAGRIAGISALGQPLSASMFGAALGLPEDDPRVRNITFAANQLTPAVSRLRQQEVQPAASAPPTPPPAAAPPPSFQTPLAQQSQASIPSFLRNYQQGPQA